MADAAGFTGTLTLEDEAKVLEDYVIGQRLGEGSYGSVFVVKYVPSGENFAVKVLQKEDLFAPVLAAYGGDLNDVASPLTRHETDELRTPLSAHSPVDPRHKLIEALEKKIVNEATVLQALNHPHVVNFFKFFNSTIAFYFLMELAEGGELFDLIISKGYFSEEEARCYFQQLISAIDYCHQQGVAHKDLKAENLLLGKDNRLLVCDFGFCSKNNFRNLDDPEENIGAGDADMMLPEDNFAFGTLHYMSPEAVTASYNNNAYIEEEEMFSPFTATNCNNNECFKKGSPESPMEYGSTPFSDGMNSFSSNGTLDTPFMRQFTEKNSSIERQKANRIQNTENLSDSTNNNVNNSNNRRTNNNNSGNSNHHPNEAHNGTREGKREKKGFMKSIFGEKPSRNSRSTLFSTDSSESDEPKNRWGRRKHKVEKKGKARAATSSPHSPTTGKPKQVAVNAFMQDLWSAGVILFFMLTGRLPFDGRDDEETAHLIEEVQFSFTEEEVERLSPETRRFVSKMLEKDPDERPTTEEIIHHPWFAVNLDPADFPHRDDLQQLIGEKYTNGSFLNFSNRSRVVTFDEEKAISTAFHKIDTDGFGKITRDQIRDMLTVLHQDAVPSEDVSELVRLFTGDPDSTEITYEQFRSAWVNTDLAHTPFTHSKEFQLANIIGTQMDEVERKVVRQLRKAFDYVDTTHSGFIGIDQMRAVFEKCEIEASEEDIVSLMKYFQEQNLIEKNTSITSNTPPVTPTSGNSPCLGVSFDAFVMGIVKREILLYHPLGKKLAAATNLAALFQSRNVTECVRHGVLVVGLQNVILDKLSSVSERLLLLYTDELVSNTENIYSFRYLGSTALLSGKKMENTIPSMAASTSAVPAFLSQSASATVGGKSLGDGEMASSLQHFSLSMSMSNSAHKGVPTIADLNRSMRTRSHQFLTSSKKGTGRTTPPRLASSAVPVHYPDLEATQRPHATADPLTHEQHDDAISEDVISNYSSDRNTNSIIGTDGEASLGSSQELKHTNYSPTSDNSQAEHAVNAAIENLERNQNLDFASSVPVTVGKGDPLKVGSPLWDNSTSTRRSRGTSRPAPLVIPSERIPITKQGSVEPELGFPLVGSASNTSGRDSPSQTKSQIINKLKRRSSPSNSLQFSKSFNSPQTSSTYGHRVLSHSQSGALSQTNGVCDVDVILAPACLGYTLVRFRRIHGKTSDFHEAVAFITNLLEVERQQAVVDIMPKGESELM